MFSAEQPRYAERGIATFPVTEAKKPAIRGYLKVGLKGSQQLVDKFADAPGLGFACSSRNGVVILDIDTKDERVLADAINRHGRTPLIARTASGKFHAYYKHSGERRRIRPWPGRQIDLLGTGGMAVVPPSRVAKGHYEFIEGSLDNIRSLPVLGNLELPVVAKHGARNNLLFRHCMKHAHHCDSFDDLLDVARTFNEDCLPQMEDAEVLQTVQSAWGYTERGQNRFGQHGAYFPADEFASLIRDQDAYFLLSFLRIHQGPTATFMVANGLAETLGWARKRLAEARHRLIDLDYLKPLRQAGRGHPALFEWQVR